MFCFSLFIRVFVSECYGEALKPMLKKREKKNVYCRVQTETHMPMSSDVKKTREVWVSDNQPTCDGLLPTSRTSALAAKRAPVFFRSGEKHR